MMNLMIWVVFQLRICRPPPLLYPLRSGHLDIKDAQCAETKDVLKMSYHIISRLGIMGIQKECFRHPKFNFFLKWPNLQGILKKIG